MISLIFQLLLLEWIFQNAMYLSHPIQDSFPWIVKLSNIRTISDLSRY